MFEQPKASINVRQASDHRTYIFDIEGELTAFAEDALMVAYNQACDAGSHNLILNFEGLEYMSSSGIGLLVTLLIRAQRRQQRLLAYGLSEHYRHILELTRLNEAIAVYPTEDEALRQARSAPQPVAG
ncbi:MAG: STAS domain-containing protein [Anaerolineae bacterium]|jgi:anti-sigma B factor antagonist